MSSKILPDELTGAVPASGAIADFVLCGGVSGATTGVQADPTWGPSPMGFEFLIRRQWAHQMGVMNNNALLSEGTQAPTIATPGAVAGTSFGANGSQIVLSTTAVANIDAGLTGPALQTRLDHNPQIGFAWGPAGVITTARFWLGWFSATPMGSATPAVHFAGFRYDTSVADTTIKAMVGNAIGTTVVGTTTMPSGSGSRKNLWIRVLNAGGTIEFWDGLNHLGTATSGVTANFPGTTQNLGYYAMVRTLAASIRTIGISRVAGFES